MSTPNVDESLSNVAAVEIFGTANDNYLNYKRTIFHSFKRLLFFLTEIS